VPTLTDLLILLQPLETVLGVGEAGRGLSLDAPMLISR
jgi:hypothetical protein